MYDLGILPHIVRNVIEIPLPNLRLRFLDLGTSVHLQVDFHVIPHKTRINILKIFAVGTKCCKAKDLC